MSHQFFLILEYLLKLEVCMLRYSNKNFTYHNVTYLCRKNKLIKG